MSRVISIDGLKYEISPPVAEYIIQLQQENNDLKASMWGIKEKLLEAMDVADNHSFRAEEEVA